MYCINENLPEFRMLVKQSGLPDFYLSAICGDFVEKHDRFPYLDEIPGADSSEYVTEQLDLKDDYTTPDKLLTLTRTNSIEEAQIALNNKYNDNVYEISDYGNVIKVKISERPTDLKVFDLDRITTSNSRIIFQDVIGKLQKLYGIQVNNITQCDIQTSALKDIPNVATAKAFIYDGQIYINTDLADKDAPLHELMHLFVGGVRTLNPKAYSDMVQFATQIPTFNQIIERYPNRTQNDIAEEAFVEVFSKYITGIDSNFTKLPENLKYELEYHGKRILDSILMGDSSIKECSMEYLYNASLTELCNLTNSKLDLNNFASLSETHRKLSNFKQSLLENEELSEICNG